MRKSKREKGRYKRMGIYVLLLLFILCVVVFVQYRLDMKKAFVRVEQYNMKSVETDYGVISYATEGSGDAILLSHGIMGGFDQGIITLNGLFDQSYFKISPSRFGYLGSDVFIDPTPMNQAHAFAQLLDELHIDQVYIMGTSAGGPTAIQFALQYPEKTKGLILLSSGGPGELENIDEVGITGPPDMMLNDFPMWLSTKYFSFIYEKFMFKSEISNELLESMSPASLRKKGSIIDKEITNIDYIKNYDNYPVETIKAPILVIQAKDDPMVSYDKNKKFFERTRAQTLILEDGGHLTSGHEEEVIEALRHFIDSTK